MIILENIKDLPSASGIYRFLHKGKPIYVGKSVNIKTRVLSHIRAAEFSKKESLIINNADDVDYQITIGDFDAIILEAKLIKKYKPKYNIVLKDDKQFLYLKITIKDEYPKVYPVRKEFDHKSLYFGPFNSATTTQKLIYYLRRAVPFCTQKKLGKQACFYSKIGLCSPCPSMINRQPDDLKKTLKKQYKSQIKLLVKILNGESKKVVADLQNMLNRQVEDQDFESAIQTRDTIMAIQTIFQSRNFDTHLEREYEKSESVNTEVVDFLKKAFDKEIISEDYRIECFDMSTLFGENSTGSMVVFENGSLNLSQYRRFKIKSNAKSDIERMQEVLKRRFANTLWSQPDLLIIDGGKPQLRIVSQVLSDLMINIPLLGIAKNPDRIVYTGTNTHKIKRTSILFKTIQLLRDESHRFAKKYHLLLRHKKIMV